MLCISGVLEVRFGVNRESLCWLMWHAKLKSDLSGRILGVTQVILRYLVLMRCQKTGRFYVLQGSTVTGKAIISSSIKESELTHLRHRELGHIREKVMTVLNKRGSLPSVGVGKIDHCVYGK